MAGGGDQAAQAVGVGAVRPGIVALTLGTSGVVLRLPSRASSSRKAGCTRSVTLCRIDGISWSHARAAGSLQWYRDVLAPHTSFDELMSEAAPVSPAVKA
jgi:xylulokinase